MVKVSLDFDDVLYDLNKLNLEFIKNKYGVSLNKKDISSWDFFIDNGYNKIVDEIWNNSENYFKSNLIDGAKGFYNRLVKEYGIDNIQIITHSFDNTKKLKDDFIKKLGFHCKVIHAKDKFIYTKDTVLIDDNPINIEKHIRINGDKGIVFDLDYGWNQDFKEDYLYSFRVKSYDQLFDTISIINYDLIKEHSRIVNRWKQAFDF